MSVRTAVIVITLFGFMIIFATYKCRGYWAVGSEWLIPIVIGMVIPLNDERRKKKNGKV